MIKIVNRLNFQPKNPLAVIDLGSNTFHMAITTLDEDGHIHVIDSQKESMRLAEVIEDGYIPAKLFKSATDALLAMKGIGQSFHAEFRLIATQAIRAANNRLAFIEHIRKSTGLNLEIIDGVEEARLSFLGVMQGLHFGEDSMLIVDIGGASTELAFGRNFDCHYLSSLKMGALLLSKRFLFDRKPTTDNVEALKQFVEVRLIPVQEDLGQTTIQHAAVTSGTAKAVARMVHWDRSKEELDDAHGYLFTAAELFRIEKEIYQLVTPERIGARWGIDARRADIILAGIAILSQLTRILNIEDWKVSTTGLREGVAIDTYERKGLLPRSRWQDLRRHSIQGFAKKLSLDVKFAANMGALASEVFDRLLEFPEFQDLPRENSLDRELLISASFLIESGKFINFSSYHRHSYYLITESNLLGFTQEEKHMIGLINRFSRKTPPKHGKADTLPYLERNFDRVNILSSCLRVARCLLRTRQIKIQGLGLVKQNGRFLLKVQTLPGFRFDAEKLALSKEIKNLERSLKQSIDFVFEAAT